MLLRRIIQHVKDQNWIAIFLDFFIVVSGVFIGLQVSNWNNARIEKMESSLTLERLQEESELTLAYLQNRLAYTTKLDADREAVVRWISEGAHPTNRDESDMTRGIVTMSWYAAISPPRSIYDEVAASGAFGNIAVEGVRVAIADYYAELDYIQSQLAFFRQFAGEYFEPAGLAIKASYDQSAPEKQRIDIDFASLANNELFKSKIVNALRDQLRFRYFMQRLLEKAERMCAALSESTNQVCEPLVNPNYVNNGDRNQIDRPSD